MIPPKDKLTICFAHVAYRLNERFGARGAGIGSVALGNSAAIQNSQCSVTLTSAAGNGNLLTLTLNVTFNASFGGNKILYLAARDVAQNNSGWQAVGVWQVPGAAQTTATAVVGTTGFAGLPVDPPTPFTFTFSDTKGFQDLGVENILVNSALDGRHDLGLVCALPLGRGLATRSLV